MNYEMITGCSPFKCNSNETLYSLILNSEINFPEIISESSKSFIKHLLERDPHNRLGMRTSAHGPIRKHEFFHKIDWNQIENCTHEPPFELKVKSPFDLLYFEPEFIQLDTKISKMGQKPLDKVDQELFRGFSFFNETQQEN